MQSRIEEGAAVTMSNASDDNLDSICEACSRLVLPDEIDECLMCGMDGLCPQCVDPPDHDCEGPNP